LKRIIGLYKTLLAILIALALSFFWGILLLFGEGFGFSREVSIGSIWYDTQLLAVFTLIMAPAAFFGLGCALWRLSKNQSRCPGLPALWAFGSFQATLFFALYLIFAAPWHTILNADWRAAFAKLGEQSEELAVPSDEALEFPPLPLGEEIIQDPYAWNVYDVEGNEVSMSRFKDKIIFLNLWATWCGFCRQEFPNIQRLYDALGSNPGFAFVLLSPEEPAVIREWAATQEMKLPLYTVRPEDLPEKFTPRGLPTTLIITPGGRIVFNHSGAAAWDGPKTREFLKGLAGQFSVNTPAIP